MGQNKALMLVGAEPLWRRQHTLLSQVGVVEKWISLRPDDDWAPPNIPRVYDDGRAGPLGGLLAALEVCTGTHLAVVATDLPQLPVSWFQLLQHRCAAGRGAIGWRDDIEGYEPLAAIYPREIISLAREAVGRAECSLQSLLSSAVSHGFFAVQTILPDQMGWFANWNRPEDVTSH